VKSRSNGVRICCPLIAFSLLFLSHAGQVSAGEITVFMSQDRPAEIWSYGQGCALTMRMFKVGLFEIEAARSSTKTGALTTTRMTYFTGGAALAIPLPRITPYAGIGGGFFHQRRESVTDTGLLTAKLVGVRLRLADLIVLKAEYRHFDLDGNPLLVLDDRISIGAGIAF
jgi:hypothetical protein